jgi:hypothetical protein
MKSLKNTTTSTTRPTSHNTCPSKEIIRFPRVEKQKEINKGKKEVRDS